MAERWGDNLAKDKSKQDCRCFHFQFLDLFAMVSTSSKLLYTYIHLRGGEREYECEN